MCQCRDLYSLSLVRRGLVASPSRTRTDKSMGKDIARLICKGKNDVIFDKFRSRRNLVCFIIGLILLLLAFLVGVTIIFVTPNEDSELYLLEIGDILGNSSSLVIVNSSYTRSSAITFSSNEQGQRQPYTIILLSEPPIVPSTITDYLPLEQFPLLLEAESEYREAFNYLGSDEPIYLLSGSSIMYNVTISSNTSTYPVCLYLFTNETHYNTFLMSAGSSNYRYNNSHCFPFMSTNTRKPTTTSFSFNITSAGQYYVGIQLQSGVTVQANASVVRVYYNTTGLQQQTSCSDIVSCSIDLCSTFLCSHESITSFLIKPSNRTSINYSFTSPTFTSAAAFIVLTIGYILMITMVIASLILTFACFWKQQNRRSFSSVTRHNVMISKQECSSQNFPLHGRVFSFTDLTTDNQNSGNYM